MTPTFVIATDAPPALPMQPGELTYYAALLAGLGTCVEGVMADLAETLQTSDGDDRTCARLHDLLRQHQRAPHREEVRLFGLLPSPLAGEGEK